MLLVSVRQCGVGSLCLTHQHFVQYPTFANFGSTLPLQVRQALYDLMAYQRGQ